MGRDNGHETGRDHMKLFRFTVLLIWMAITAAGGVAIYGQNKIINAQGAAFIEMAPYLFDSVRLTRDNATGDVQVVINENYDELSFHFPQVCSPAF